MITRFTDSLISDKAGTHPLPAYADSDTETAAQQRPNQGHHNQGNAKT